MLSRLDVTSLCLPGRTAAMPNQMSSRRITRLKATRHGCLYLQLTEQNLSSNKPLGEGELMVFRQNIWTLNQSACKMGQRYHSVESITRSRSFLWMEIPCDLSRGKLSHKLQWKQWHLQKSEQIPGIQWMPCAGALLSLDFELGRAAMWILYKHGCLCLALNIVNIAKLDAVLMGCRSCCIAPSLLHAASQDSNCLSLMLAARSGAS